MRRLRLRPARCSGRRRRRRTRGQRWGRSPRVGSESPTALNPQTLSAHPLLGPPVPLHLSCRPPSFPPVTFCVLFPFLRPLHSLCLPLTRIFDLFPLPCPSHPFIPKLGCFEPPGCCGAGGMGGFRGVGLVSGGLQPGHPQGVPGLTAAPPGHAGSCGKAEGTCCPPRLDKPPPPCPPCAHPAPSPARRPCPPRRPPQLLPGRKWRPQPPVLGCGCCWVAADPLSLAGPRG